MVHLVPASNVVQYTPVLKNIFPHYLKPLFLRVYPAIIRSISCSFIIARSLAVIFESVIR